MATEEVKEIGDTVGHLMREARFSTIEGEDSVHSCSSGQFTELNWSRPTPVFGTDIASKPPSLRHIAMGRSHVRLLFATLIVRAHGGVDFALLRDIPVASSGAVQYLDSNETAWTVSDSFGRWSIPAAVPGDLLSDLQAAGGGLAGGLKLDLHTDSACIRHPPRGCSNPRSELRTHIPWEGALGWRCVDLRGAIRRLSRDRKGGNSRQRRASRV